MAPRKKKPTKSTNKPKGSTEDDVDPNHMVSPEEWDQIVRSVDGQYVGERKKPKNQPPKIQLPWVKMILIFVVLVGLNELMLRLLYQCVADHESQLSGAKGDVITECIADPTVPGWLYGTLGGKKGWVPENYCEALPEDEDNEAAKAAEMKAQEEEEAEKAAAAQAQRIEDERRAAEAEAAEGERKRKEQAEGEERIRKEEEEKKRKEEEEERIRNEEEEEERKRKEDEERKKAVEEERRRKEEEEAAAAAAEEERKRKEEQELEDRRKEEEAAAAATPTARKTSVGAASDPFSSAGRGARGGRGGGPRGGGPRGGGAAGGPRGAPRGGSAAARARGALMRKMSESVPNLSDKKVGGSGHQPRGRGRVASGAFAASLNRGRGGGATGSGLQPSSSSGSLARSGSLRGGGKLGISAALEKQFGGAPVKAKPKVVMVTVYKAMFTFESTEENQLGFTVGDIIRDVTTTDTGWSSGSLKGKSGWFPTNYAQKTEIADSELDDIAEKEKRVEQIGIEAPDDDLSETPTAERTGSVCVTVNVPQTSQTFSINTTWDSTFELLVKTLQGLTKKIADHSSYSIFVNPASLDGVRGFVSLDSRLSTCDLLEDTLEYTAKVRSYTIKLPNSSSVTIEVDSTMSVKAALEHLRQTTSYRNIEYKLYTENDDILDRNQVIWLCDVPQLVLYLKMPKFQLNVLVKGAAESNLEVDYNLPVTEIVKRFCAEFSFKFSTDLFFTQLGGMAAQLKPQTSLLDQRVNPIAAVLLKSKSGPVEKVEEKKDLEKGTLSEDEIKEMSKSLWKEPSDSPNNIVVKESTDGEPAEIKSASLNKLIERLTSAHEHDMSFTRAFLLTYMSFTTPRVFLHKLVERYSVPETHAKFRKQIQLRVCNVMRIWIESSYDDFDHELTETLVDFIDGKLIPDGFNSLAKKLRTGILQRTCSMKAGGNSSGLVFGKRAPMPKIGKEIASFTSLFDFDEEEICRQITIIDFLLYQNVKPSEFLNQSWNKPKLKHKAVSLLATITRVNRLGNWCAFQILQPDKPKARAKRWTKLIRIAYHLRAYNNFNGLMAFIGGMNNSAIMRLKQTKALMSKKNLDIMEELANVMSTSGSYKNFRATLHKLDPPCIPYIGVYLRDLTFIEDGNPSTTDNGLINFEKRRLLFKTISEIQLYQQSRYNLEKVQIISKFLHPLPENITDNMLYDMSLKREAKKKT